MSVTQAALAVVATFIGSSLLTIAIFYLFLRLKQNRRRRSRAIAARGISYPRKDSSRPDSGFAGYETSVANLPPAMAGVNRASLGSVQDLSRGDGAGGSSGGANATLIGSPPKKVSYALFPKTPSPVPPTGRAEPESPSSRYSIQAARPPSLQQWLREGSVSPFGTLRKDAGANKPSPNWPFGKKVGAASSGGLGVGGVNAGGGGQGKVMQPNRGLPLRES